MGRLNDIKVYWNYTGYSFTEEDMLEGRFILEDDAWFEGVIGDSNKGEMFIFGIYHPCKTIELMGISSKHHLEPVILRGKRDVKGYDARLNVLGENGERTIGASHIITRDVVQFQESRFSEEVKDRNVEEEKKELIKRTEELKELMRKHPHLINLYEDMYEERKDFSASVLDQYQNGNFRKTDSMTFRLHPKNN